MILELLPPLHSMHKFYLLFKAVKCHMKVCDTIVSSKTAKYTGIVDCIGCVKYDSVRSTEAAKYMITYRIAYDVN